MPGISMREASTQVGAVQATVGSAGRANENDISGIANAVQSITGAIDDNTNRAARKTASLQQELASSKENAGLRDLATVNFEGKLDTLTPELREEIVAANGDGEAYSDQEIDALVTATRYERTRQRLLDEGELDVAQELAIEKGLLEVAQRNPAVADKVFNVINKGTNTQARSQELIDDQRVDVAAVRDELAKVAVAHLNVPAVDAAKMSAEQLQELAGNTLSRIETQKAELAIIENDNKLTEAQRAKRKLELLDDVDKGLVGDNQRAVVRKILDDVASGQIPPSEVGARVAEAKNEFIQDLRKSHGVTLTPDEVDQSFSAFSHIQANAEAIATGELDVRQSANELRLMELANTTQLRKDLQMLQVVKALKDAGFEIPDDMMRELATRTTDRDGKPMGTINNLVNHLTKALLGKRPFKSEMYPEDANAQDVAAGHRQNLKTLLDGGHLDAANSYLAAMVTDEEHDVTKKYALRQAEYFSSPEFGKAVQEGKLLPEVISATQEHITELASEWASQSKIIMREALADGESFNIDAKTGVVTLKRRPSRYATVRTSRSTARRIKAARVLTTMVQAQYNLNPNAEFNGFTGYKAHLARIASYLEE